MRESPRTPAFRLAVAPRRPPVYALAVPNTPSELLKTAEVAKLLRVHPKHVYRLIDAGLPGRRVGGEWRFLREEVLAWSATRSGAVVPGPSGPPVTPAAPLAAPSTVVPPPIVAANGDLVIDVLLAQLLAQKKPALGFLLSDRRTAFEQLAARTILLAGFHGEPPPSHLDTSRLARIHLVRRLVGLGYPAGARLRTVKDLAGRRLASRPPTAGVRAHFDRALSEAGTSLQSLSARSAPYESHREAVCAVLRGEADAALTTAAWAEHVGLRFLELAEEPYDVVLFAEHLGVAQVVGLCEVAQTQAFRAALSRIAGYDARDAGEILYLERRPPTAPAAR